MGKPTIRYVTREELQAVVDDTLAKYPWMATYPIDCHASCARWEIADGYGYDAGDAWDEYQNALWLLGRNPT